MLPLDDATLNCFIAGIFLAPDLARLIFLSVVPLLSIVVFVVTIVPLLKNWSSPVGPKYVDSSALMIRRRCVLLVHVFVIVAVGGGSCLT